MGGGSSKQGAAPTPRKPAAPRPTHATKAHRQPTRRRPAPGPTSTAPDADTPVPTPAHKADEAPVAAVKASSPSAVVQRESPETTVAANTTDAAPKSPSSTVIPAPNERTVQTAPAPTLVAVKAAPVATPSPPPVVDPAPSNRPKEGSGPPANAPTAHADAALAKTSPVATALTADSVPGKAPEHASPESTPASAKPATDAGKQSPRSPRSPSVSGRDTAPGSPKTRARGSPPVSPTMRGSSGSPKGDSPRMDALELPPSASPPAQRRATPPQGVAPLATERATADEPAYRVTPATPQAAGAVNTVSVSDAPIARRRGPSKSAGDTPSIASRITPPPLPSTAEEDPAHAISSVSQVNSRMNSRLPSRTQSGLASGTSTPPRRLSPAHEHEEEGEDAEVRVKPIGSGSSMDIAPSVAPTEGAGLKHATSFRPPALPSKSTPGIATAPGLPRSLASWRDSPQKSMPTGLRRSLSNSHIAERFTAVKVGPVGFLFGEQLMDRNHNPTPVFASIDMAGYLNLYNNEGDMHAVTNAVANWSLADGGVWAGTLYLDSLVQRTGVPSHCVFIVIDPSSPISGPRARPYGSAVSDPDGLLLVLVETSARDAGTWVSAARHVGGLPSLFGAVRLNNLAYTMTDELDKCRDRRGEGGPGQQQDINRQDNARMRTVLHFAVERAFIQNNLQMVLSAGADVNRRDRSGSAPLHVACKSTIGVADLLHGVDIDVDIADGLGQTPLHIACIQCTSRPLNQAHSYRCYDNINALLRAGASVNSTDLEGQTPLHILTGWSSVSVATVQAVEAILAVTELVAESLGSPGRRPTGDDHTLRSPNKLLSPAKEGLMRPSPNSKRAVQVDALDKFGRTALFLACKSSCKMPSDDTGQFAFKIVTMLLEAGANPNAWCSPGSPLPMSRYPSEDPKLTALLFVAGHSDNCDNDVMRALIHGNADVQMVTADGGTLFHVLVRVANSLPSTHAFARHIRTFMNLLDDTGLDPLQKNNAGQTPMDLANSAVRTQIGGSVGYWQDQSRKAHEFAETKLVLQINGMDLPRFEEDNGFHWMPLNEQRTSHLVHAFQSYYEAVQKRDVKEILALKPTRQHAELKQIYMDDRTREKLFWPIFREVSMVPMSSLEWGKDETSIPVGEGSSGTMIIRTAPEYSMSLLGTIKFLREDNIWKIDITDFEPLHHSSGKKEWFFLDSRHHTATRNKLIGPLTAKKLKETLCDSTGNSHQDNGNIRVLKHGDPYFRSLNDSLVVIKNQHLD